MSAIEGVEHIEKEHFSGKENDVEPPCPRTMTTTDAPPTALRVTPQQQQQVDVVVSPGDGVSVVQGIGVDVVQGGTEKPKGKRKCRRGRAKAKRNSNQVKPYAWKTPLSSRRSAASIRSSIVPYNTNKFLMEDHMPEMQKGRQRDPSLSLDSDENYFCSLPEDEEEFLTKEFSSVYENAKCERLDGLTKNQLIQEYLQLEANFEMVSKKLNRENTQRHTDAKEQLQQHNNYEVQNHIRSLEEHIHKLTQDNMDLSKQLEFYRTNVPARMVCSSSEDSESDSSSTSSSSSSCSSREQTTMFCDAEDDGQGLSKTPIYNGYSHSQSPTQYNGEILNGQHPLSPNPQSPTQYNSLSPRG
uniref:Putative cop9 signalosome subunit csn8 n=1 Tax=Nyssomyia neivai TaxID=330878 RepID=A0A1L8DW39_9DIPT